MKPIKKISFEKKDEFYKYLNIKLLGLVTSESNVLSNFSNIAALLGLLMEDINWAGFYFLKDNELKLGPFYGKPACTTLTVGRGVCGTAVEDRSIQMINNVDAFDGHVACDPESKSEIVFPIIVEDVVIGVLDIDSPIYNRFDEEDYRGLERILFTIKKYMDWESVKKCMI